MKGVLSALSLVLAFGMCMSKAHANPEADARLRGRALYRRACVACHGILGDGRGPAAKYLEPRPRDFTSGAFRFRTTASGEMPTDDDLLRVVSDGIPGTSMPSWKSRLTQDGRRAVIAYLRAFSEDAEGEASAPPSPIAFGVTPTVSADLVEMGRRLFADDTGGGCAKCHGPEGRGDGPSAPTLEDDRGNPIAATDLSRPWTWKGGARVEDVYRTLTTGLNGTPMPSWADALDETERWSLAYYVRSLAKERTIVDWLFGDDPNTSSFE